MKREVDISEDLNEVADIVILIIRHRHLLSKLKVLIRGKQ